MLCLLCGCEKKSEQTAELPESVTASETTFTSSEAATPKTEAKQREIQPLSPSRKQAYFQNGEISVTAELTTLQSSLYYPDIVHDFGANPDLFVVTAAVKVKNMTEKNISFDETKLLLSDMFYCGGDTEEFKDIQSEKSAIGELRFLCSLEQAAEISGVIYDGEYFEEGKDFYPEEFNDIIDIQSADDVAEYLYRRFYIHSRQIGYFWLNTEPSSCELHHIRAMEKDGKNYLAISFSLSNRSDYAQLIEPSAYRAMCGRSTEKAEEYNQLARLEPIYISIDEELIYEPTEVELELTGVGKLYEIPEFICMTPENPTDFTIIYDFEDFITVMGLYFKDSHTDEPYYSKLSAPGGLYGNFNWNAWEEDFIDS